MTQTKSTILIVVLFAAAAFLGGYLLRGTADNDPEATPTTSVSASVTPARTSVSPVATAYKPQLHTVTYSAVGVSPATLTIRAGDAVRFRNTASVDVWPASDPHPSHGGCPGFDAQRRLRTGEEYTLTFPDVKTCTYHSHLDPSNSALRGTIIVR
jgi:plastocyanin